jgi:hypothetical protein
MKLIGNKDQVLILHPEKNVKLHIFVNADFAGTWHRESLSFVIASFSG